MERVTADVRFEFGENWSRFLSSLDDDRIRTAEESLVRMLGMRSLEGKTFLDIGCGSGLFSLAARRLGAAVHSFDYDMQSVSCAEELRRRYEMDPAQWKIEQGSILDRDWLDTLPRYDIVYSWGVLHHTGAMWEALDAAAGLVKSGGHLFIAIYNDQGVQSRLWTAAKRLYNAMPRGTRWLLTVPCFVALWGTKSVIDLVRLRPFRSFRTYSSDRGMSPWRDVVDWVGGYPFEVAKPEAIFDFYRNRGFSLSRLVTCGGKLGCNQFVFVRHS
jgi:2-polyprenyl-6-hydroxyphenyl methylase/3-demethylubiquinone-9 3-methyltransferase